VKPEQFRLLIHHHHQVYLEDEDRVWVSSTLGRWVNSLSPYFNSLRLLLYQSRERRPQQDTLISGENVQVLILGHYGRKGDRIERLLHLNRVCRQATPQADGLLLRGITPRQYAVWKRIHVSHKAFLLVGSLTQKGAFDLRTLWGIYTYLTWPHRVRQLQHMAREGGLMMANSHHGVEEQRRILGASAHFVPTSSLKEEEFARFHVRPLSPVWRLLYCGRLDMAKGVGDLIQALKRLKGQGYRFVLDFVGSGVGAGYSQIVNLVRQSDLVAHVHFHGFVPFGARLFEYYRQADALILPSYSEGFPHVIWEAAANCCPVIASDVGGIATLFEHNKHGILVPPGAAEAIARAIVALFENEALRQRLIENAYKQALNYTLEACARKLVDTLVEGWRI